MMELLHNRWIELFLLMGFLTPIVVHDIRFRRIPDVLVLPAIGVFVVKRMVFREEQVHLLILSGMSGFVFILFLNILSRGKIGLGDGKLSALLAIVFGFIGWLFALFIASSFGLAYGVLRMKFGGMKREEKIPYAPFLTLGGLVSFLLQTYRLTEAAGSFLF